MAEGFVRSLAIGLSWDVDNQGLIQADSAVDGIAGSANEGAGAMGGLADAGEDASGTLSSGFKGFKEVLSGGLGRLEEMKFKLAAVGAAGVAAITQTVRMAGDMEGRLNTLNREFDRSARVVTDWARDYARATELSEMQLIDWSATLGINLRMLDLTSEEMAGVTKEMIELTHNFAHFADMDPEQAFNAIHMAIRGGRFPRELRDITGAISRTDIATEALNRGLIQQGEEMTVQIERIATLSMLQEKLAITQGAAAEGQEEVNTGFARFRGILGDITRDIGNIFLPTFSRGLGVINDFLEAMRESRLARVSAGILGVVTAAALLGAGLGGLVTIGKKLSAGLGIVAGAVGIAKLPLLGLAAVAGGLVFIIEDLWVGFQGGESVIFNLVRWISDALGITENLQEGFVIFAEVMGDVWDAMTRIADGIISIFVGLGQMIWGFLTFDTDLMLEGWERFKDGLADIFFGVPELIMSVGLGITRVTGWLIRTAVAGLWDLGVGLAEGLINSILWIIETGWNAFADWIEDWLGISLPRIELPEISLPRWPDVVEFVGEKWEAFKGWLDGLEPLQTLRDAFAGFREWLPELPEIRFSLSDIIAAVADFTPVRWIRDRFAGFRNWLPELPEISFSLSDIVSAIADFSPIQWLRDRFAGFRGWLPSLPEVSFSLSNIVTAIADFAPIAWLRERFAGFRDWLPELPDIQFSLSGIVEAVSDFAPVQWLRDAFAGFAEWFPGLPDIRFSLSAIITAVSDFAPVAWIRERFVGFREWSPELPKIDFSLSNIVTAVADFSPVSWLRERFAGFREWSPGLPQIEFSLTDLVTAIVDFSPIDWIIERFTGFAEWIPEKPDIDLSMQDIVTAIIDFSPITWLREGFAGFAEWFPGLPDISFSLSDIASAITDFSPVQWLQDSFAGFDNWLPEFPDITGAISDWWEGIGSWIDENLSTSGLIEGALDVAGGIGETIGGWFRGDDGEQGDVEAEAAPFGQHIEHQGDKTYKIKNEIKFFITESDDPEATGRIVEKKLRQFFEQELAEAGG